MDEGLVQLDRSDAGIVKLTKVTMTILDERVELESCRECWDDVIERGEQNVEQLIANDTRQDSQNTDSVNDENGDEDAAI